MIWFFLGLLAAIFPALTEAQIYEPVPAGTCLCFTSPTYVADSPCGNNFESALEAECYISLGTNTICDLGGGYIYEYYNFDYLSMTGWADGRYLRVGDVQFGDYCGFETCQGVEKVSRASWGARAPSRFIENIALPLCQLFVHHSGTPRCTNQTSCSAAMRSIQDYDMDVLGFPDIAHNQLIGEDGRWYEGRGWPREGSHTDTFNKAAVSIAVIGFFNGNLPNDAALTTLENLLRCAERQNVVRAFFKLHTHRDIGEPLPIECPGDVFYPWIRTLPQYCLSPPPTNYNPCTLCTSRP